MQAAAQRTTALFLAASLSLLACDAVRWPAPSPNKNGWPGVYALAVEGRVETCRDSCDAAKLARLTELASQATDCPARDLQVRRIGGLADVTEFAAEGCGRRALYLDVHATGEARAMPGHRGASGWVSLSVILPLAAGLEEAHRTTAAVVAELGLPPPFFSPPIFDAYFEVHDWGVRDLECPPAQVLPLLFSRGAMAEGCGKRASYWGQRLSCIVPIKP